MSSANHKDKTNHNDNILCKVVHHHLHTAPSFSQTGCPHYYLVPLPSVLSDYQPQGLELECKGSMGALLPGRVPLARKVVKI